MRFGADVSQEVDRLGKFGLGLKLASLSQARELRVVTAQEGVLSGRGWLENGIAHGFASTVFDPNECAQLLSEFLPDRKLRKSGTAVCWSQLYRLKRFQGGVEPITR
jgi:hypothetical protein